MFLLLVSKPDTFAVYFCTRNPSKMSQNVILHPKVEALQRELERLRQRSSELYLKVEYMQFEEKPVLYSLYETQIGKLEFEEFQVKVEIQLLTYETKLIQAYINRNECIDEERIAEQIRFAQEKYKAELKEKEEVIKAAQAYLTSPALSIEESTELRDLYRMIAKNLHPDLHPDLDQKHKDLFLKAVSAYRIGDIHVLRQIALALTDDSIDDVPDVDLQRMIDQAAATVKEFEERIARMNREFPFIYRDKLCDKAWIEEQKVELEQRIAQAKMKLEEVRNYIMMLKIWKPNSLS